MHWIRRICRVVNGFEESAKLIDSKNLRASCHKPKVCKFLLRERVHIYKPKVCGWNHGLKYSIPSAIQCMHWIRGLRKYVHERFGVVIH